MRASESSRRIRCSSSAAIALEMDSSLPSSTIPSGSTKSVWPDCDALWTMPGTAERALASTGSTYRSFRMVKYRSRRCRSISGEARRAST